MTITIADGRGALWQWDTGRRVKITDGDGVKQVHYQNRCFGRSVDVDVGADGTAIIPDELLQDCHTLVAYAYVTDDAGGYTKVQQDFAVYKRPKPSDYVYTPTEHAGFDRLRAEIGDLDDLTTEDKSNLVAAINEAAASGGGGADWQQNDPDGDGYIKNRPGGYTTTELTDVFNGALEKIAPTESFAVALGDTVKVVIDGIEKEYTVVAEEAEGIALRCFGTDTYMNIASGAVTDGFVFVTYTYDGADISMEVAVGSYVGKMAVVKANVTTDYKIPSKYLEIPPVEHPKEVYILDLKASPLNEVQDAIDSKKLVIISTKTICIGYRSLDSYGDKVDRNSIVILDFDGDYMDADGKTVNNKSISYQYYKYDTANEKWKFNGSETLYLDGFLKGNETDDQTVSSNLVFGASKSIVIQPVGGGKKFKLTVDNTGALKTTEVTA